MAHRKSMRNATLADVYESAKPHAVLAALTALAAAPIALLVMLVPRELVVPALSLVAIALSALVALVAWVFRAQRHGDRVTAWDMSGALALIGCAAAMLSKPENVLQLLGTAMVP